MIGRCVLAQQAHEAVRGAGVEPEGRSYDVGGGMSPVLMIVMHAAQHRVSQRGLGMNHFTCSTRSQLYTSSTSINEHGPHDTAKIQFLSGHNE